MEVCLICGKRINPTKGNCVKREDGYVHKKCPKVKETLSSLESDQYKSLIRTINEQYINKPSAWYQEHSINWRAVTNQIRTLKEQGYTYEEMEYAAIEVFKEFGTFFGFGAVVNRIVSIIAKRNKRLEIEKSIMETHTVDVGIDLSSIIEEDVEW
ncbi:MAG: hypothetical protein U0L26_12975 [Cellulosilyticum sp.]|nr:hypothetical protein [Cellulosilyticum sp.]